MPGIPDALAPLDVASRRNGCLHICTATEEIAHSPQNRPEGYLPIPPAGPYRHGLPAPRGGGTTFHQERSLSTEGAEEEAEGRAVGVV